MNSSLQYWQISNGSSIFEEALATTVFGGSLGAAVSLDSTVLNSDFETDICNDVNYKNFVLQYLRKKIDNNLIMNACFEKRNIGAFYKFQNRFRKIFNLGPLTRVFCFRFRSFFEGRRRNWCWSLRWSWNRRYRWNCATILRIFFCKSC